VDNDLETANPPGNFSGEDQIDGFDRLPWKLPEATKNWNALKFSEIRVSQEAL